MNLIATAKLKRNAKDLQEKAVYGQKNHNKTNSYLKLVQECLDYYYNIYKLTYKFQKYDPCKFILLSVNK